MKNLNTITTMLKGAYRATLLATLINFPFSAFCQTGTVGSPFTALGMARNVSSAGVYYFNLTGTTFSTYVDANGWVQVAIDFGASGAAIPGSTSLTTSTRGILSSTALAKLGSATETRFYCNNGQLDVSTSNATVVSRITSNTAISVGSNDNSFNGSWTGTNTQNVSFLGSGCNSSSNNTLGERVFHACGNFDGFHWVSYSNMRQLKANLTEIASNQYFQLYVRAPLVAVVNGPTINTQPSSAAQNLCLNSASTNLSVSATSGTTISYQWYSNTTASNSGGTLISGATSATYTPLTSASGTKYYYVICTHTGGATTSSVSGAITVSPLTVVGTVSANQSICSGTTTSNITLTGNTGSVQWQISTDNNSFSDISGATSTTLASATIGALTATRYYRAVVTSGTCSSVNSLSVTVTVTSSPTITSTTPGSYCGTGSVSLSATASAGTLNWYAASTGGSSLGSGTTFNTPSISVNTTYYVEATNGSCNSVSRTAVLATINTIPTSTVSGTQNLALDILVVGGGGGAGYFRGGGGGGGGYIYTPGYTYSSGTSTTITVGVGGTGGTVNSGTGVHATSGTNSSFGNTYVAVGGGGGGSYGGAAQNGYAGGSGGGGANQSSSANTGYGGAATSGQGYGGGNSRCGGGGEVSGGGGGGAGGAGSNGSSSNCGSCNYRPYNPGSGGNGLSNSITGVATYYCGGGGGGGLGANPVANDCNSGAQNSSGSNGLGGGQASYGGGGQCKLNSNVFTAENGGPGIVIIRYLGTPIATGGTITQVGGYTIHTFTTSGTFSYAATATTQVSDVTRCGVGTVDFVGTASAGYTLDWYATSTGGTALATSTLTYTTPTLNQTTVYYVATKNSSTGCVSATRTAVSAILNSTAAISNDQTICIGSSPANIVLSSYTGTTQWQSSSDNVTFTNIAGQTSATLTGATVGILSANKYFRSSITNGACTAYSPVVTIEMEDITTSTLVENSDRVWNGATSTNWSTISNWYVYNGSAYEVAASLPSASTNVIIPINQTCVLNQPSAVSGIQYAKDIVIEDDASLTLGTGSLLVSGNFVNLGTFDKASSTVNFNGTSAQTIEGQTDFNNLTVSNSSGGLTLNSPIRVAGNLTMNQGNIYSSNTNILEIGLGLANTGSVIWTSGTVVGPMKRWFGPTANLTTESGIFPIGNNVVNRYAKVNFTQNDGVGGYIIAEYKSGGPIVGGVPLYNGLPAMINGAIIQNYENEGYYEITPYSSIGLPYGALNAISYDLVLRGNQLTTVTDLTPLRIIKSSNHTAWNDNPAGDGTHAAASGTNSDFTIGATGMIGFSWFNIGSSNTNVLPVELNAFSATCEDDKSIVVNWTTVSENNSSHFMLDKSRDGLTWINIDSTVSVGNSTEKVDYSYVDNNVYSGTNYYRLSQFDTDGESVVYDVISMNCMHEGTEAVLNAFPNPNNGEFTLEFSSNETAEHVMLSITDSRGIVQFMRNVHVNKGINSYPMDLNGLSTGIYFVQFELNGVSTIERVYIH